MWVRIDDRLPVHPKMQLLSDGAFRLYVTAICWCNAHLTDGVVPSQHLTHVGPIRRPRTRANELVEAGLWEVVDDGWRIHDYLIYQASSGEITKRRDQKRDRQRRWLRRGDPSGDASGDPSGDASGDPSGDASGDPSGDATCSRAGAIPNPSTSSSPPYQPAPSQADPAARGGTRAPERILIETIQGAISNRTGKIITDGQALNIAAHYTNGHAEIRNPVAYISAAIMREPHPYTLLPPNSPPPPPSWKTPRTNPDPQVAFNGASTARTLLAARQVEAGTEAPARSDPGPPKSEPPPDDPIPF